jgi:hypothetical protein
MSDQKGSATSPGLFCFRTKRNWFVVVTRCVVFSDVTDECAGNGLLQNRHAPTLISRYRPFAPVRSGFPRPIREAATGLLSQFAQKKI